jgi:hypothetical protein
MVRTSSPLALCPFLTHIFQRWYENIGMDETGKSAWDKTRRQEHQAYKRYTVRQYGWQSGVRVKVRGKRGAGCTVMVCSEEHNFSIVSFESTQLCLAVLQKDMQLSDSTQGVTPAAHQNNVPRCDTDAAKSSFLPCPQFCYVWKIGP